MTEKATHTVFIAHMGIMTEKAIYTVFTAHIHAHAHRSDFYGIFQLLMHQLLADLVPRRISERRFRPGHDSRGGGSKFLI
jgi:hypothetical protein